MPDDALESQFRGKVAGIDEAGRGPWAGPVVAAAVILRTRDFPAGIDDSKKLSPETRADLYEAILEVADAGIGMADVNEIDIFNIRRATHLAMARAVAALPAPPAHALVDGRDVPPLPCPGSAIVGGDALSVSIAAASIVAKVTRDRMMIALDGQYPGYGWCRNKGYGTEEHRLALHRLGPCRHHRRSFAPIHNILCGVNPGDSIVKG